MSRWYRLLWCVLALPAFASEAASASGSTAVSSTVCMSFPVALLLAAMPMESIVATVQRETGIQPDKGDQDAS
ncbi:hypothetical protein [Halostella sp. PRR32]|uniref:hypothetical protein n=1 Tax=Halostella sp. PRR32 TaxID=3098147 RepID=UPI002B1E33DB|nr:hypothetical protein [Halostella sp. PRR32]